MSISILVARQIGAGRVVDHLSDDHLALGDLAPLSVDGDEHRLVERREQKCGQGFLGPTAGVAGLALLEAGVQRRLAVIVRVFALCLGHVVSLASSSPDAAYADCRKAPAAIVALFR